MTRRKSKRQPLPPRGTGLIRGTARPRGRGMPLSDAERRIRHGSPYGFKGPLGGVIINRVRQMIKRFSR